MAPSTRRRSRRSWPQRLLISFNILLAIACLAAAGGLSLVRQKLSKVQVVSLGVSLAPQVSADEPRNILIIGTDSAARLSPNDPIRKQRPAGEDLSDVIMVMRLDPKANSAALLSIPRDSWVPIAPFGTKAKINSAIAGPNGPQNLIETIKQNFGISIDNYVEIDFEGFRGLVQALGGIPVYLTEPVRDRYTGLLLTQTGCITLDPVQSLAWARSRHLQYMDPKTKKWTDDPTGDLGRISRQQDFIQLAAQRAVDEGARNPATALSLIDAARNAVTIDDTMTLGEMQSLADHFGNFNVKELQKYQLPTSSGGSKAISYQNVEWDQAQPMLDIFRGLVYGESVTPRVVEVSVGPPATTGTSADSITTALAKAGFDSDTQDPNATYEVAPKSTKTVIRYGPRGRVAAGVLARWLDASVTFTYDAQLPGARLLLSPGVDFKDVRTTPLPASAVQTPSLSQSTTTTTAPLPVGERGRATTTTTTPASQQTPGGNGAGAQGSGPTTTTTTTPPIGVVPVGSDPSAKCG